MLVKIWKKGTLRYCWWEGKMTSHYENSTGIPQKVKNRTTISNNSTVGYLSKENKALIRKDICTFMFIVALFTSVKIWKQPMCPPINRWMDKDLFLALSLTHTEILLIHKKEWNLAICDLMDRLRGYYAKWNKSDKER